MKSSLFIGILIGITGLLLSPMLMADAGTEQTATGQSLISQPLAREGEVALMLVDALKMGKASNEAEAESMLGKAGIAPRNGWIADYPVTPDIVGELQKSIMDAADSKRLTMAKNDALKAFQDVLLASKLSIRPSSGEQTSESTACPDSAAIDNYYDKDGLPVVTYCAPPPDYNYHYAWDPYPFGSFDFWFPAFFVLHDFHKVIIVNKRVVVITNHFNDVRVHRVFRIDPVARFNGRTFAGIGAPRTKGFISTGVRGGAERIFNRPKTTPGAMSHPTSHGGRMSGPPSRR